jgi:hypothetical protein
MAVTQSPVREDQKSAFICEICGYQIRQQTTQIKAHIKEIKPKSNRRVPKFL